MSKYTIYVITNIITKKKYVGITSKTVEERFKTHINFSKTKEGNKYRFYQSIKKYGEQNFDYDILEFTNDYKRESFWIKKMNTVNPHYGYNMQYGGAHGESLSGRIPLFKKILVCEIYKLGNYSIRKISKELFISEEKISQILRENNIEVISGVRRNILNNNTPIKLINIQTNEEYLFESKYDAAKWLINHNLTQSKVLKRVIRNLSLVLNGVYKTIYKFKVRYN